MAGWSPIPYWSVDLGIGLIEYMFGRVYFSRNFVSNPNVALK